MTFKNEFAFIITNCKVVRINLDNGHRDDWKLQPNMLVSDNEHLEICEGVVLGEYIWILTTKNTNSCPAFLSAVSLDFGRPNPAVDIKNLTRKLTHLANFDNIQNPMEVSSNEIKMLPLQSIDDSTTHEILLFGGQDIIIVDVEIYDHNFSNV